ncbi:hypothetical protein [Candidatus Halocynthiibacter alkanivorans]|uniref:hypothetical protein n=1 Tax=Candidatus Halocynthiibacter alkanivorans TaxID=2267619 RepID=UPI000DF174FD|nr:hypothetical protein [Candidatus Halocynthiibacter alkanivorans]
MFANLFAGKKTDSRPSSLGPEYPVLRKHVLARIAELTVGDAPFFHAYIENILPGEFYEQLHRQMRDFKKSGKIQDRKQDNAEFTNQRCRLPGAPQLVIRQFRALFEDAEIKRELFRKFYVAPDEAMLQDVEIHEKEFEFVFCKPDRFQNIHVDIPPKYMSFVFYLPSETLSPEAEEKNATILYDRSMKPVYGARFRKNSVCVFVPHFYSYHGFSSTIERDVIVMFYVNKRDMKEWRKVRHDKADVPKFDAVLDLIESKVRRNPLIEYGDDPSRIEEERAACQINAPLGRVLLD